MKASKSCLIGFPKISTFFKLSKFGDHVIYEIRKDTKHSYASQQIHAIVSRLRKEGHLPYNAVASTEHSIAINPRTEEVTHYLTVYKKTKLLKGEVFNESIHG